jgi:hypothetical protein
VEHLKKPVAVEHDFPISGPIVKAPHWCLVRLPRSARCFAGRKNSRFARWMLMHLRQTVFGRRGMDVSLRHRRRLLTRLSDARADCQEAARNRAQQASGRNIAEHGDAHRPARRSRSALPMTDTELKLMAAAAIIGDRRRPKNGYSRPAAIGTPAAL